MRQLWASLFMLVAIVFLVLFFLMPAAATLQGAVRDAQGNLTLAFLQEVFLNPICREGFINAGLIATASTFGCLLISIPLASFKVRFFFPGRNLFHALVLAPLLLPPFVGALGVQALMGQMGAFNSLLAIFHWIDPLKPPDWLGEGRMLGVILMNVLHLYPLTYMSLASALQGMDPALEEAAESLGAPPLRRLLKITVPLMIPSLFAGGSLTFIWSFTELGVPLMFDVERVTSVQVFNALKDLEDNPFPFALVVVLLISTTLMFLLSRLGFKGRQAEGGGRGVQTRPPQMLVWQKAWSLSLIFGCVWMVSLLPHMGLAVLSFSADWYQTVLPKSLGLSNYRDALGNELALSSIANSLRYASISALIDMGLGVAIAWVLIRTRIPGRGLLDALVMMPLSVPGIVLALGYLALSREGQPLAWLMLGDDPLFLLAVAYSMRRLPYVVRSVSAGLMEVSPTLEEAGESLGASPLRVFRRITLPLVLPSVIAGGIMAFSFAMLEVSDSMILAQRTVYFPITKAIYTLAGAIGDGPLLASALGVWAMLFLIAMVAGLKSFFGRGVGRWIKD